MTVSATKAFICSGDTVVLTAIPTGGTGTITYLWNMGATSQSITVSPAFTTTFSVTATDALGCKFTVNPPITVKSAPILSLGSNNASCATCNDGSAYVTVSGGGIYMYKWSNGSPNSSAGMLTPGNYSCTVTDTLTKCSATGNVQVNYNTQQQSNVCFNYNQSQNNTCVPQTVSFTNCTSPAAVSYKWKIYSSGNGGGKLIDSSTTTNYSYSFKYAGQYQIQLDAFDVNGNHIGNTQNWINLNGSPGQFDMSASTACVGDVIEFEMNQEGKKGNSVPVWNFGDGTSSSGMDSRANHVYTTAGTYNVKIIFSSGCGSGLDSITQTIAIGSSTTPTIAFPGYNIGACPNDEVHIELATGASGKLYWDMGDGTKFLTLSSSVKHNYKTAGSYTVTVIDTNGCNKSATASTMVTISSSSTMYNYNSNIRLSADSVCAGDKVWFDDRLAANSTLNWGDGKVDTNKVGQKLSHIYSKTGSYNLIALQTNGCGRVDTAKGTITVSNNAIPQLMAFVLGGNQVCPNDSVSLLGAYNSYQNYKWSFGNGDSSIQYYPVSSMLFTSYAYSKAGTYTPTLQATNSCGIKGTSMFFGPPIVVTNNAPFSYFQNGIFYNIGNDEESVFATVCTPVQFYGMAAASTYKWDFGDGTVITNNSSSMYHTYLTAGSYIVTLTATTSCGKSGTFKTPINITGTCPQTTVTITATSPSCFNGSNGSATANTGGGTPPYTYSWTNGATTSSINNLAAGYYSVTVKDGLGKTATASVTITQPAALNVNVTTTNSDCGVATGIATANVTGGIVPYTYSWSNGGVAQSLQKISAGTYQVTVTDKNNCMAKSLQTIVIANPSDFKLAITASPQAGAAPLMVAFNNNTPSMANYNFTWFFGDATSLSSNKSTEFHTYTANGTYDIGLVAMDKTTGCTDTITKPGFIYVTGGTSCTHTAKVIPAGPIDVCTGTKVVLHVATNAVAPFTYQWNINGTPISGATDSTFSVTQGGYYSVTVIKNSCTITSAAAQVIFTDKPATPTITATGSIVPCQGGNVTLTAATISGVNYKWNTGATTQAITVSTSGYYVVTATNSTGCSASSSYTINGSLMPAPSICLVTVDDSSKYNQIVWEKAVTKGIKSFRIYRELTFNNYQKVGEVPYNNYSVFVDSSASPNSFSRLYKLTVVDTCNNESSPSAFHKSILLQANIGVGGVINLSWNNYEGSQVDYYRILRDDNGLSKFHVIDSVSGSVNAYTDNNPPTTAKKRYVLDVVWKVSCAPTAKMLSSINTSRSNIKQIAAGGSNLTLSASATNASCGNCDGSATVNITGGTAPFTYSWSNKDTTATTKANLCAGIDTVTVTDANGYYASASVAINSANGPTLSSVKSKPTCSTCCDGKDSVVVTGGKTPYRYSWSTSTNDTTAIIKNICDTTFTVSVSVTDASNCKAYRVDTIGNGVGIKHVVSQEEVLNVYPNPTSDVINIEHNFSMNSMSILNVYGQKVHERKAKSENMVDQINVANLAKGFYILQIETNEKMIFRKIVIE